MSADKTVQNISQRIKSLGLLGRATIALVAFSCGIHLWAIYAGLHADVALDSGMIVAGYLGKINWSLLPLWWLFLATLVYLSSTPFVAAWRDLFSIVETGRVLPPAIAIAIALGFGSASTAIPASAAGLVPGVNLFFIKRSLNANEVHYDAVVDTEDCSWVAPYVESYWRELQTGPKEYSQIQFWEARAYGIEVDRISDRVIEIRLRPLVSANVDRPVTARLTPTDAGCSVTTTVTINGAEAEFQAAYIKVADSWLPGFDYFDILGYVKGKKGSGDENDRVYERFVKKQGAVFGDAPRPVFWQSGVIERGLDMGRPD